MRLVLLAVLLTGCSPTIPGYRLARAVEFCAPHKGVHEITASTVYDSISVVCVDGEKTSVK